MALLLSSALLKVVVVVVCLGASAEKACVSCLAMKQTSSKATKAKTKGRFMVVVLITVSSLFSQNKRGCGCLRFELCTTTMRKHECFVFFSDEETRHFVLSSCDWPPDATQCETHHNGCVFGLFGRGRGV